MRLTSKEKILIRFALHESLNSNKKTIADLESSGSNAENDSLFKDYLEDNKIILDLIRRLHDEVE